MADADITGGQAMSDRLSLWRRARLWGEFSILFVGIPLAMAFVLSPYRMRDVLGAMFVIGLVLLAITPGWRWRRLVEGPVLSRWPLILAFTAGSAIVIYALVLWLVPSRLFAIPLYAPELMQRIAIFYPLVLVTAQELLFRPLFFERYGLLFPSIPVAIIVNSLTFGLAHLFFWNWPAVVLTTIGSVFFALAYVRERSFPLAWLLHAIAGLLVFAIGLGVFFYHGAVGR